MLRTNALGQIEHEKIIILIKVRMNLRLLKINKIVTVGIILLLIIISISIFAAKSESEIRVTSAAMPYSYDSPMGIFTVLNNAYPNSEIIYSLHEPISSGGLEILVVDLKNNDMHLMIVGPSSNINVKTYLNSVEIKSDKFLTFPYYDGDKALKDGSNVKFEKSPRNSVYYISREDEFKLMVEEIKPRGILHRDVNGQLEDLSAYSGRRSITVERKQGFGWISQTSLLGN